ncbi:MarR family transcriptional regulator [Lipingzhangella sp. LS1_29]|uniref:MarR family transcriptional regulator n=1 Tax=Lipingzhangella rawalii TaxID=2055835 RepID=A0ABU2H476_9ACTN|nr:MarR family transcriptional regulator [Lipingzhangella rawalii]MDS1270112.1 MarR family transcriptional regulator [Lipingzhangella rawalii]
MAGPIDAPAIDPLLLRHVAAEVDRRAEEIVHGHGLTLDQWRTLDLLHTRGPHSMAALTSALGLTGPTATRVADHLVTTALAYRDADTTDRRRVVLRVSRRGTELHDQLSTPVHAAQAAVLSPLDDTERATLVQLLRKVVDRAQAPSMSE